jgi:hypothetical protein
LKDHPEYVDPLARAMAMEMLPSLVRLNCFALDLNQSSLMVLAQAISDGHLLDLAELDINLNDVEEKSEVLKAFATAYVRRLAQGAGGAEQANLEDLEISGLDDDHGQLPLMQILRSPYTQDLKILDLQFGSENDQPGLLATALDYVSGPEALASKRPHLGQLYLPCLPDDDFAKNKFVEALTTHQVCPKLYSLDVLRLYSWTLPDLARIYEGVGFRYLRSLNLGILNYEASSLREFLLRVAESPDKGGALRQLGGEWPCDEYDEDFAVAFCDGLKAGAFPRLQELELIKVFCDADDTQHLVDAMTETTSEIDTCQRTLRSIYFDDIDAEQEAALGQVLGGQELTIRGPQEE